MKMKIENSVNSLFIDIGEISRSLSKRVRQLLYLINDNMRTVNSLILLLEK